MSNNISKWTKTKHKNNVKNYVITLSKSKNLITLH